LLKIFKAFLRITALNFLYVIGVLGDTGIINPYFPKPAPLSAFKMRPADAFFSKE